MTDNNHPITPPPWVVQAFLRSNPSTPAEMTYEQFIATCFARWGADQELEACCEWLLNSGMDEPFIVVDPKMHSNALRAARRPKPKSLAEEGYDALDTYIYGNPDSGDKERTYNALRRALKRLQELEGQANG